TRDENRRVARSHGPNQAWRPRLLGQFLRIGFEDRGMDRGKRALAVAMRRCPADPPSRWEAAAGLPCGDRSAVAVGGTRQPRRREAGSAHGGGSRWPAG